MTDRILTRLLAPVLVALTVLTQIAPSQAPSQSGPFPLTGVWRCQLDGLPAVTLAITDEGGALGGAILFYVHTRKTVNDPYKSTPGVPEPLFHMSFDGKTLTFQVSHRRAHPPRTLSDPPVIFTLTLTGPKRAELVNKSEKGLLVAMVRRDD